MGLADQQLPDGWSDRLRLCHPARPHLPTLNLLRPLLEGVPSLPVLPRLALPHPLHGPLHPQRLEEDNSVGGLHLPRFGADGAHRARHHHRPQDPPSPPLC